MKRSELSAALKCIMLGVDKGGKAGLLGGDAVVFSSTMAQSYNGAVAISYPVAVGIDGAVKAAELAKILDKMAGEDVEIARVDNGIMLKCGATKLLMHVVDSGLGELLQELQLEALDWVTLPEGFMQALDLAVLTAARNAALGPLNGVFFGDGVMASSDNMRAVVVAAPVYQDGPSFILPVGAADVLRAIGGLNSVALSGAWAHFLTDNGTVISARLLGGEFPLGRVREVIARAQAAPSRFVLPAALRGVLERVGVLAYSDDADHSYIVLKSEGGTLLVKGEQAAGAVEEALPVTLEEFPDGVEFGVCPSFLLDVLDSATVFSYTENVVYFKGLTYDYVAACIARARG